MCGICGYLSGQKYRPEILTEMNNTMIHRGPDDAGIYQTGLSNGLYLGLGQRRLSILDLSSAGHQPMLSDDRQVVLVYNGEVYNYIELREELELKGYRFRSACDTEVILNLYLEYGIDCLTMLNGMFGLAIADLRQGRVMLARDRMGKKPLYYYRSPETGAFVFASELKPIMAFPEFRKEIRTELISGYLVNKCFDSPDTVFRHTWKVQPGECVIWEKNNVHSYFYWDLLETYQKQSGRKITDYAAAKDGLVNLLSDSVEKRMISDVPLGTFLSGGIDSTVITALAQRTSVEPIRTYTIGFSTQKENEAEYAKAVAKHIGTNHTELYVSKQDLLEQIQDICKWYDEPFADSSQIPTMLVSKLAKGDVSVILSGDGGDELFCGYEQYDWMLWAQKLDWLGKAGHAVCHMPLLRNMALVDRLPDKMNAFLNNRDQRTKLQLFADVREKHTRDMIISGSESAKRDFEEKIHEITSLGNDWQTKRMLLDMRYYMADEVLVKTDRGSMKYSLEIRCPLLDYRIVEYSFRVPLQYKYRNGKKKYILKDIAYDLVPRELLDRPNQGFGVPVALWLRNDLNKQLRQYADPHILKKQSIFEAGKISEFIQRLEVSDKSVYSSVLWGFMMFQMWYQEYVEDLW